MNESDNYYGLKNHKDDQPKKTNQVIEKYGNKNYKIEDKSEQKPKIFYSIEKINSVKNNDEKTSVNIEEKIPSNDYEEDYSSIIQFLENLKYYIDFSNNLLSQTTSLLYHRYFRKNQPGIASVIYDKFKEKN